MASSSLLAGQSKAPYPASSAVPGSWSLHVILDLISSFISRFLPSSGLLSGVLCIETDVSGLLVGPIFNGQAILFLGQLEP